jgi:uncharacterized protein (DUF1778 family)
MCHNVAMSDSPSSSSKRRQLRFDAGPHGPAFDALCAREGVKPTAMLQRLVARAVADEERRSSGGRPASQAKLPATDWARRGPKKRREFRLTASETSALEAAAAAFGGSVQDYVIAFARAHAGIASCSEAERLLLSTSNYQLLAIGRNLNQVARMLNSGQGIGVQEFKTISETAAAVREHVRQVSSFISSVQTRWVIDEKH